jgi:hypothetical protein
MTMAYNIPQPDLELLKASLARPSIQKTVEAGVKGIDTSVSLASKLQAMQIAKKKQEDDLMSQITELTRKQREQDASLVTPEEIETKKPMSKELSVEKAKLFGLAPEQRQPRPFALQAKGRTTKGEVVSFDPNRGIDVVSGGQPYSPETHGQVQPMVDPTLAGEQVKEVANLRNSVSQLNEVKSLFDKSATGPVQSRLQDFQIKTGIEIPVLRELTSITDEKVKFRTATQSAINDYIKAITGAQMSEPEAKRIMRALPNRNASDEAFIPALEEILKLSDKKLKNQLETYKALGYRNIDQVVGLVNKNTQESPEASLPKVGELYNGSKIKAVRKVQ